MFLEVGDLLPHSVPEPGLRQKKTEVGATTPVKDIDFQHTLKTSDAQLYTVHLAKGGTGAQLGKWSR